MSGEEVTAQSFYYKFERALGLGASDNWLAGMAGISDISQISVDGKHDLTITLSDPNPLFGALMRDQDMGVYDPSAIAANATDDDTIINTKNKTIYRFLKCPVMLRRPLATFLGSRESLGLACYVGEKIK